MDPRDPRIQEKIYSQWLDWRMKARTDLLFLCCQVLGYTDVSERVHGKIISSLQQFKPGKDNMPRVMQPGQKMNVDWAYAPAVPMYDLPAPRKRMVLVPRGGLKTSVCTEAHTIQWTLNYPDVRVNISTGTGSQAEKFIAGIKNHFQFNNLFRFLFPEFVPPDKHAKDWGRLTDFTVPCRTAPRKEPTVSSTSVGAVIAGSHYDVIKHDDLVDKENVRTPEQIQTVIDHFGMMGPLLQTVDVPLGSEKPNVGWIDLIGTRYDFSDLYGTILDAEEKKPVEKREWVTVIQPAKNPDGTYWWPERIGEKYLKSVEEDPTQGSYVLASQFLMNPIPDNSGLVDDPKQIIFVPKYAIDKILPMLRLHCTIDLHGMEVGSKTSDNDYTVLDVAGFGRDGRPYVVEIRRGRFTPDQVINQVFDLYEKYPRIVDFKIEKDAHARVLLPFLHREMSRRGKFPLIVPIKRDNRVSKVQRIKGLQPWFRNGDIRFCEEITCRFDLVNEIMRFPKYAHDDILDTLADHLQNRDGELNYDVVPQPQPLDPVGRLPLIAAPVFMGFHPDSHDEQWLGSQTEPDSGRDPRTGY